ncbi:GP88 family protein [Antarctobacter heliothermus]|uniref:GP88 family protein n=1 Tax=Antarctobacter heliothermus TaxID=74033 RepID=UPI003CCC2D08
MEIFPETTFYDYTKHHKRMFRERPQNYHLTFSLHEKNSMRPATQRLTPISASSSMARVRRCG